MIGVSGEFHLRVVNAQSGNCREERYFQNVILDVGLESFAKYEAQGSMQCAVGKGTNAPQPTDVGLGSFKALTGMNFVSATSATPPNYEYSASSSGRFNAGAISDTITEIGIRSANSGTYWCRQLILDEHGAPSSLTVLPNEYLDVTYTIWYYPPLGQETFSFNMNGVTYSCVSKAARLPQYSRGFNLVTLASNFEALVAYDTQTLGDITSEPAGTTYVKGYAASNIVWNGASDPYSWSGTLTLPLNAYNVPGGIGSMLIGSATCSPMSQISFSPKLPKDELTQMSLTFSRSIGRYKP